MYDLLIRNAILIDSAQGLHAARDVAFASGRVAAVARQIDPRAARQTLDETGQLLTPGWIGLHVHAYEGVSYIGFPADRHCLARGVTTAEFVDAHGQPRLGRQRLRPGAAIKLGEVCVGG